MTSGKMQKVIFATFLLLCFAWMVNAESKFRLTNLKCEAYHKSFAEFSVCRLKVPSRDKVVLNMHVVLHQVPVNNVTVHLALLKKASGYRPFLYNFTLDFCQFMRNKRTNPFLKICIERLLEDSNINHTCPYDHDIILTNLYLTPKHFELLPLPLGDYLFHIKVAAYNEWKADIKIYITNY